MTREEKKKFEEFLEDATPFYMQIKVARKNEFKTYKGVYNDRRLGFSRDSLPKGLHVYQFRGGDRNYICTLEDAVVVNFSGTVILLEAVDYNLFKQYNEDYKDIPMTSTRVEWSLDDPETAYALVGTPLELKNY